MACVLYTLTLLYSRAGLLLSASGALRLMLSDDGRVIAKEGPVGQALLPLPNGSVVDTVAAFVFATPTTASAAEGYLSKSVTFSTTVRLPVPPVLRGSVLEYRKD